MQRLAEITNATKAQLVVFANTGFALALAFGLSLTDLQIAAVSGFGNAAFGLWIALTFQLSAKRDPLA